MPEEWEWSSYRAQAGLVKAPIFLTVNWIQAQFGKDENEARKAYANFVFQGIGGEYPNNDLAGQIILAAKDLSASLSNK